MAIACDDIWRTTPFHKVWGTDRRDPEETIGSIRTPSAQGLGATKFRAPLLGEQRMIDELMRQGAEAVFSRQSH